MGLEVPKVYDKAGIPVPSLLKRHLPASKNVPFQFDGQVNFLLVRLDLFPFVYYLFNLV